MPAFSFLQTVLEIHHSTARTGELKTKRNSKVLLAASWARHGAVFLTVLLVSMLKGGRLALNVYFKFSVVLQIISRGKNYRPS